MAEVTEKDVRRFQERTREFAKTHPDFNQVLEGAAKRGLNLSPAHSAEIVRLGSPETIYYLADPANEAETREINVANGEHVNDARAVDRIRRIASRLKRHDVYTQITARQNPTDTYLEQRRAAIRRGDRRR